MPKQKPNRYTIDGRPQKTFEKAAAKAIDLSLEREDSVTIVEQNPNTLQTYYITVTAQAGQD